MHKVMSTSDPSIVYKTDITNSCLAVVEELKAKGHELFYTIDAGPQVKIICNPRSSGIIKDEILSKTRVKEIIHTKIGGPPSLINEN